MYERNPLTGTILQVLTEELAGGRVIYRTYRRDAELRIAAGEPLLALPEGDTVRRTLPAESLRAWTGRHTPRSESSRLYAAPLSYPSQRPDAAILHARPMRCISLSGYRIGWESSATIGFSRVARGVAPGQQLAGKVAALHPPQGRFWADPMIVRSNGQAFMFFEDYDYSLRRARISVVELDASGRAGAPRTALQADHHLSYPFVFEWRGAHFMVPETASVNAVRLYRAVEFPTRWEYVQDLLSDIKAVDATICEHGGRWYLFTGVSEAGGSSWDELFLFVADTPMGPWAPHPMNPIVSDVRSARPGGALFRRDGVLYRPGQNSPRNAMGTRSRCSR